MLWPLLRSFGNNIHGQLGVGNLDGNAAASSDKKGWSNEGTYLTGAGGDCTQSTGGCQNTLGTVSNTGSATASEVTTVETGYSGAPPIGCVFEPILCQLEFKDGDKVVLSNFLSSCGAQL